MFVIFILFSPNKGMQCVFRLSSWLSANLDIFFQDLTYVFRLRRTWPLESTWLTISLHSMTVGRSMMLAGWLRKVCWKKHGNFRSCFTDWPCLNIKTVFPRYGDSHVKIRLSRDRLIFNMGIPILVRQHLYIETAPWSPHDNGLKWMPPEGMLEKKHWE